MTCFRRSNDLEMPAGMLGFNSRPGTHEPAEALFRVNTSEREDNTLDRRARPLLAQLGEIDPGGNDRDGIGQTEAAHFFIFLFARRMNASCTADRPTLK